MNEVEMAEALKSLPDDWFICYAHAWRGGSPPNPSLLLCGRCGATVEIGKWELAGKCAPHLVRERSGFRREPIDG